VLRREGVAGVAVGVVGEPQIARKDVLEHFVPPRCAVQQSRARHWGLDERQPLPRLYLQNVIGIALRRLARAQGNDTLPIEEDCSIYQGYKSNQ
jgi:hypothetical protein